MYVCMCSSLKLFKTKKLFFSIVLRLSYGSIKNKAGFNCLANLNLLRKHLQHLEEKKVQEVGRIKRQMKKINAAEGGTGRVLFKLYVG